LTVSAFGSSPLSPSSYPSVLFNLHQLLLVPSIIENLLFVRKFSQDNNVYFEFFPHCCNVKSQVTREVLLCGHVGADGLYYFPNLHCSSSPPAILSSTASSHVVSVVTSTSSPNSFNIWHFRLGHPHVDVLKLVLSRCNFSLHSKKLDFCLSCCIGKSHRLPSSSTIYT